MLQPPLLRHCRSRGSALRIFFIYLTEIRFADPLSAWLAPTMSESLHKSGERYPAERGEGIRSTENIISPASQKKTLLRIKYPALRGPSEKSIC